MFILSAFVNLVSVTKGLPTIALVTKEGKNVNNAVFIFVQFACASWQVLDLWRRRKEGQDGWVENREKKESLENGVE